MYRQHVCDNVAPTFNENDAVRAGLPDAWDGIQVQVSDGWVAVAALHGAPEPGQVVGCTCDGIQLAQSTDLWGPGAAAHILLLGA